MYEIVTKKELNPTVTQMEIKAPLVANKALPGQFIILRVDDMGERIPLTVAGVNKQNGTVKIIFQIVGATTNKLNQKNDLVKSIYLYPRKIVFALLRPLDMNLKEICKDILNFAEQKNKKKKDGSSYTNDDILLMLNDSARFYISFSV